MTEKYYSILTNRGKELEAQSSATGQPVIIKDFVVGDGNGQAVIPDPARTALVKEVYRGAISALKVSPEQANQWMAHIVLPSDVGGFTVREVGLLTDAGELYAVANCAAIEKPESGVSISMQFRLAVNETASIELKVATGDGLFLRQDANLSDVKDVGESRKHLGLKGAAILDVGKTAGTVAAGDDTRIVNALQKGNNLSDVVDKEQARANLELKSAAIHDVQTSRDDVTAGRVLANGGALALRTAAASGGGGAYTDDCNNLPVNSVSFVYGSAKNSPGFEASVLDFSGLGGQYRTQIAASYSDGGKRISIRTCNADIQTWNAWKPIITADGGSVDYLANARFYSTRQGMWQGGGAFANQLHDPTAPFYVPTFTVPNDTSVYLPICKGSSQIDGRGYVSAVSFGALRSGGLDFGSAVIQIIGDSGKGAILSFSVDGDLNVPRQINGVNIAASGGVFESGGAVRVYSPNNPQPIDLTGWATQAWVLGNFVQDMRLLGRTWISWDGSIDAPPGCVFVSGGDFGSNDGSYAYAAVQKLVNGNWYTVAHA